MLPTIRRSILLAVSFQDSGFSEETKPTRHAPPTGTCKMAEGELGEFSPRPFHSLQLPRDVICSHDLAPLAYLERDCWKTKGEGLEKKGLSPSSFLGPGLFTRMIRHPLSIKKGTARSLLWSVYGLVAFDESRITYFLVDSFILFISLLAQLAIATTHYFH